MGDLSPTPEGRGADNESGLIWIIFKVGMLLGAGLVFVVCLLVWLFSHLHWK